MPADRSPDASGVTQCPLRDLAGGIPCRLSLTADLLRFYCDASGITLGKFVIQTRSVHSKSLAFCAYLIHKWKAGQAAEMHIPAFERDNVQSIS